MKTGTKVDAWDEMSAEKLLRLLEISQELGVLLIVSFVIKFELGLQWAPKAPLFVNGFAWSLFKWYKKKKRGRQTVYKDEFTPLREPTTGRQESSCSHPLPGVDPMSTRSTPAEKSDDRPAHSGSPESQRGTENHVGVTHERLAPADNREPAQTYPNCSRPTTRPAEHAITAMATRPSARDTSASIRRRSKAGRSASSPSKRKHVVAKPQVSSSPSPDRELSSRKTKRKSGIYRSLMAAVDPESQAAEHANSSTHAKPHQPNDAATAAARLVSEEKFQPNRITSEDTAGTTSANIDTYAAATASVETQEKASERRERKAKAGIHSKAKRSKAIESKAVATTLKTGSTLHTLENDEELSTLQNLRYHVMWIVALSGLLMVFVVLLVSLREGPRTPVSPACGTPACVAYSKVFEGVLNYSVDPCDDMDAFVCSKGAGYHTGGWLTPPSLVAHAIRRYQLQMVDLFLSGNTKFTASKIVTDFLLECTSTYKTPQGLDSFIDIFDLVPVPWPFEYSSTAELHPLEAALTLSIKFGVDTWFRAYMGNSKQPASGSNTTLALFIESCAKPTLWLSFLHAMGDRRELYFEELHRLYNATLPDSAHRDSLLATEKGVLSILHSARTQGPRAGPAVASIAKIAAFVHNSTLSNWLEAMTVSPGGHLADEKTLVALDDVRILRAVNALLSTYSVDALSKHLSWWLVQILTIIGWSRGFYVIAGSQAAAAAGAFVECYSFAASKFGLLMASESAVSLFTREVRQEVESFFSELTTLLKKRRRRHALAEQRHEICDTWQAE
ncbi:hypothetical protein HPB50_011794 [Hyalomma asiaticum]|uniref:Uncharacterized protein n=1 Tax=Hyalomma asiaticum TaxID=266040 RepID=A0ACB7S6F9_HYAAI|nr:hypothetical protein HPB50_011794 [Hyalomma asiaticum]